MGPDASCSLSSAGMLSCSTPAQPQPVSSTLSFLLEATSMASMHDGGCQGLKPLSAH